MHKEILGQTEFTFELLDSQKPLEDVFRLRYQVYCKECKFIREEDYPNGIEKDKYDPHSLHFAAKDRYGIIGTARLILDSPLGLPFEEHYSDNLYIDKNLLPRKNMAQISRLVISKEYRKRINDGLYYTPDYNFSLDSQMENPLNRIRPMPFGLYREIYQESKRRNITHWYTMMEKSLFFLLHLHGFIFKPIGEEINFYGPVRLYVAVIEEMEENLSRKFPNLIQYFIH